MRAQSNVLHRHKTDGKEMTLRYDRRALAKSCEILTFLIRDLAYLTTENFEYCIHCIRTFIEVIIVQRPTGTSRRQQRNANTISRATSSNNINADYSIDQSNYQRSQNRSESPTNEDLEDLIREEMQNLASEFLTLLDTLHTRAVQIYKYTSLDQSKASVLWSKCWCPILQGSIEIQLILCPNRISRTRFEKSSLSIQESLVSVVTHDEIREHLRSTIFNVAFFYPNFNFFRQLNGNLFLTRFYFHF